MGTPATLDDLPMTKEALSGASAAQIAAAQKVEAVSVTAEANLHALAQAQIAFHTREKRFVTFAKGGAAHWKTLGVEFPQPVKHVFKAKADGTGIMMVAEANLDKDPFVDRWLVQYDGKNACPPVTVLAMDSLNLTFEAPSGDRPYSIIASGTRQPRLPNLP